MHGHGKYSGAKYDFEGEFVNGKRQGPGISRAKNGDVYEGSYKNDVRHGKAVCTLASGTRIVCTYADGVIVGEGEKYFSDGGVYKGGLSPGGLVHGKGVWELPDGSRYEGEHDMGYRHGKGVMTLPDGTKQIGWFEKDEYIGPDQPNS
jgi:hypothetical protein